MKYAIFILFTVLLLSCQTTFSDAVKISGDLQLWHKVILEVVGPATAEWADENPFLDYKLEVLFSQGDKSYTVPGYYAADGYAGESSSRESSFQTRCLGYVGL